ncbi:MAG: hypothetical protein Pars92KO_03100 [Parasphingorhabdus sp.]
MTVVTKGHGISRYYNEAMPLIHRKLWGAAVSHLHGSFGLVVVLPSWERPSKWAFLWKSDGIATRPSGFLGEVP